MAPHPLRKAGDFVVSADPYVVGLALFSYPVWLVAVSFALRICGVDKRDVAKWALRQARRERFRDLITAVRGSLSGKDDDG